MSNESLQPQLGLRLTECSYDLLLEILREINVLCLGGRRDKIHFEMLQAL